MKEDFKDKIGMLFVGSIFALGGALLSYLAHNFSQSFVAQAKFDIYAIEQEEKRAQELAAFSRLETKLDHVVKEQDIVRRDISWIKRNLYRNGVPIREDEK